jgi:hypothetical protein
MTDIQVTWDADDGTLGTWCGLTRTIAFHSRQSQAQRRCTATHEIVHAELAHDGPCTAATELLVLKISARRLISLRALAEAVLFHLDDRAALAHELWVDRQTLDARLDHLHPGERGYLAQHLARREQSA